jgi:AAA ATPase domain
MDSDGSLVGLVGRSSEIRILQQLASAVQTGGGKAVVIRGHAGIGKSALIGRLVESAPELDALRVVGIESEMELPFGGLHQLCVPLLGLLSRLPEPQQHALGLLDRLR